MPPSIWLPPQPRTQAGERPVPCGGGPPARAIPHSAPAGGLRGRLAARILDTVTGTQPE